MVAHSSAMIALRGGESPEGASRPYITLRGCLATISDVVFSWTTYLIAFLISFGAALRVTRLITTDVITQPFRDWIGRTFGFESKVAELIHCPWCSGFWVCLVTWPLTVAAGANIPGLHDSFEIAGGVLALSLLVGATSVLINNYFDA